MFMISNYSSFEYVKSEKSLTETRKKSKRNGLGIRVLDPLESQVSVNDRLYVSVINKCLEGHGYKRSMYHNSLIVLSK